MDAMIYALVVAVLAANALGLDGRRLAVELAEQDFGFRARPDVDQRHGVGARVLKFGRVEFIRRLEVDPELEALGMICNSLDVAYDTFGEVRDESGMVYPVVHQFDRFGELQRDLNRRMPLDPQLLVANRSTCSR